MIRMDWLVLAAAGLAAALPLARPAPVAATGQAAVWPRHYEGRVLAPLPPAPEDARLARGFPGSIARFSDGRRQLVFRKVGSANRQLHPARDCFKASGYAIAPSPMRPAGGGYASCFIATRGGVRLRVCEHIVDAKGRSFADVASWYWPALLGTSAGPWLAVTAVERVG
jgi:hypothetical protein